MQSTRKFYNLILGLAILFVFSVPQGIMAQPSVITNDLKQTIDQVIEIMQDEKLKSDPDGRRKVLRKTIDQRFDFEQMAVRALAKNWGPRSSDERAEFVKLFRKILERTYANKIENFGDGEIRYVDEIIKGKFAMVKTKVQQHGKFVQLDYKLINAKGKWKVYDFIISGVSMIRNYRSQFSKTLEDKSFKELMESLERSADKKA